MNLENKNELVMTRTFDAPRTLVWQAWTDPQHIQQWWGPQGFTGLSCEMEMRVGGKFRLDLRGPDGVDYPCTGTYQEVQAPTRIVYAGEMNEGHPCGAGLPPRSVVTITFDEHDDKTTLTIHTRFESPAQGEAAMQAGYKAGWAQSLERLASTLKPLTGR